MTDGDKVIQILRESGPMTREELTEAAGRRGVGPGDVADIVYALRADGLIIDDGGWLVAAPQAGGPL